MSKHMRLTAVHCSTTNCKHHLYHFAYSPSDLAMYCNLKSITIRNGKCSDFIPKEDEKVNIVTLSELVKQDIP